MEKYTAGYFIDKFTKTSESSWARYYLAQDENNKTVTFGSEKPFFKGCALGHCGVRIDNLGHDEFEIARSTEESRQLEKLFNKYLHLNVTFVNDCPIPDFKQKTPRQRILMALIKIESLIDAEKTKGVEFKDCPETQPVLV